MTAVRGLDVVIGYQVSWLLIFGDYPRYTRSPGKAAAAVFLGLALTSLWFLPLGFVAARAAGSTNPGAMLAAAGIGGLGGGAFLPPAPPPPPLVTIHIWPRP